MAVEKYFWESGGRNACSRKPEQNKNQKKKEEDKKSN